jgi:hypothetical protein
MRVSNELEAMQNELIVACLKIPLRYLAGGTEENH